MNTTRKHILFFLLLCSVFSYGQQVEVLEKINDYYSTNKHYNIEVSYKMYRGYTGENITESYTGNLYKDGNITSMEALNAEIWIFPNAQLTIDTANKSIYYTKTAIGAIQNSPIDTKTFSRFYKEKASETKGNTLRYEMVLKNIQIPSPYSKIVLWVNATTYELEAQELFFANKLPFVDEAGNRVNDYGRLKILFQSSKNAKQTLKLSDIITIKNNTVQLASRFNSFTLIDQTKHNE